MKRLVLRFIRWFGRCWCGIHGAEVASDALIHGLPSIRIRKGGRIVLEGACTINAAAWSNPLNDGRRTVLYAGKGATLRVGEGAGLSGSVLIATEGIEIGAGTLVGAGCLLCDSDMHEIPLGSDRPIRAGRIRLGKNVFVGARCTILKGVTIGDGAVISAHTLVNKDIPAGARYPERIP